MQNKELKVLVLVKVSLPIMRGIWTLFPLKMLKWMKYPKARMTELTDGF